jgi:hypothetical protein
VYPASITRNLPADSRGWPTELTSDLPDRLLSGQPTADVLALTAYQRYFGTTPRHTRDATMDR